VPKTPRPSLPSSDRLLISTVDVVARVEEGVGVLRPALPSSGCASQTRTPGDPRDSAGPRPVLHIPAVVWIMATILCHLPSLVRPMLDDDEAVYATVAGLMNAGGRLYASGGVDNKFPGIYWLYALVFRACGLYAMTAVHLVALAFVLGTAAVLGSIARTLAGDDRAFGWAALFYGAFSASFYPKMLAANTELFMMLPLACSIELGLRGVPRRRDGGGPKHSAPFLTASGGLLVVGCLFKQVALLNAAVPIVLIFRRTTGPLRLRSNLALAMGSAIMGAAIFAIVSRTASLDGLWRWAVWSLLMRYGCQGWSRGTAVRALVAVAGFLGSTVALNLATARSLRERRGAARDPLLWSWLVSSAIAVALGGRFFGHYFLQLIAPLSVVAAIQTTRDAQRDPRWGWRMMALTAFPASAFSVWALMADPMTGHLGRPDPDYLALGKRVQALTQPGDRIFVWGNFAPIYVAAGRLPSTRFVGFLRGLDRGHEAPPEQAWDVSDAVWTTLRQEFETRPPAVVIDTSTGNYSDFRAYPPARFPAVEALITAGFIERDVVEGATLYSRRSHDGSPGP